MDSFTIRSYLDTIARINDLPISNPGEWFFFDGMLFLSRAKWWADFGTRHAMHEGLDIALFKNRSGKISWLDTTTGVPAMAKGEIINVCPDFLGQSVIVRHEKGKTSRIVSVYSHMRVPSQVTSGREVEKGDIVGYIADTSEKRSGIHCHLHISLMEITNKIADKEITWEIMGKPDLGMVKIFNPW